MQPMNESVPAPVAFAGSPASSRPGQTAPLWLALVAAVGGVGSAAWLSSLLSAAHGCDSNCRPVLQDPTQPHETLMRALAGSQLVWTVLGVTALVLSVSALRRRGAGSIPVAAAILSALAPLAVVAVLVAPRL